MAIQLLPLPFGKIALEPHMSARTLEFHHGRHHKAYVDKTNELIQGTGLDDADLPTIVRRAKADGNQKLFNQAGQAWNHDFLWQSLSPGGGGPRGRLAEMIENDFDGLDGFAETFKQEAVGHFASGWAWLCLAGDRLTIVSTHDADTPLVHDGLRPLLTLDLWEHAYYLDYQNARPEFVEIFLNNLVNWEFAARSLDVAQSGQTQAA